jgi:hypothetical protein
VPSRPGCVHASERTAARVTPSAATVTRAQSPPSPQPGGDGTTPAPGQIVMVRGTGASGARLRGQPGNNRRMLAVIPEYTPLVVIGPDRNVDRIVWRKVRAPNGTEGWIAASFVTTGQPWPTRPPSSPAAQVTQYNTPASPLHRNGEQLCSGVKGVGEKWLRIRRSGWDGGLGRRPSELKEGHDR